METMLGIIIFIVAVLAILQGWQMKRRNPNSIAPKLDIIIAQLGKMEQRLNDIWDKVNK